MPLTAIRGRQTQLVLLTLFTVVWGIALGAGLYEQRIEVPRWIEPVDGGHRWNADAAREADTGLRFWAFVTTGPLTVLTLAGLVAVWGADAPARRWWLGALAVTVVERAATFGYFIPTLLALIAEPGPDRAAAADAGLRWAQLGWARQALALMAFLAALRALGLLHRQRPGVDADVLVPRA